MMSMKVLHLVDDTTAGGVMQVVNHLTTSPDHARVAQHQSLQVKRGALVPPRTNADLVVSHLALSWRTLPSFIALRLRFGRKRLVHVEHSYTAAFVRHNVASKTRFETLLRLGFRQFGKVVAVSAGQREWMRHRQLVHENRLHLIRSFADLTPFLGVKAQQGPIKHFGAIGRLERQKGFDLLIKAFRKTDDPALRLTFFGTGGEEKALKSLAGDDPRISFAGYTATPEDAYRAVDAVVMPSRWEAYGLVAIEAMCAGRHLICHDVDGLKDHETHGAVLASGVDPEMFDVRNDSARSVSDRRDLVEQLSKENLRGWSTLMSTG